MRHWHFLLPLFLIGCAQPKPQPPGTAYWTTADVLAAADKAIGSKADVIAGIDEAKRLIANNLAHVDTIGFKSRECRVMSDGTSMVLINTEQGALNNTGNPLDIAIQGEGFFEVTLRNGSAAYTRNGNLIANNEGILVVATGDGYKLGPTPIKLPQDATDIDISADGEIRANRPGAASISAVGQIVICRFRSSQKLNSLGGGLYGPTEDSGEPTRSMPQENGAGQLLQGFLESSNVNLEREKMRLEFLNEWRTALMK